MCGICGYISKNDYDEMLISKMTATLIHRGPDDGGTYQARFGDSYHIAMGHRRLSILDLSSLGHQPMMNDDSSIVLTYNGEIYNFLEIRRDLKKKGYLFKTECDTEVVLKAYQEYGINCLKKFNGMFALAIYDKRRDCVILARDRLGVKPLYYYFANGDLVWGSELKPVMVFPGFHKDIRQDVLSRYFCHKFIKAPDTIFEDTWKLEPGQYIVYTEGDISTHIWWDVLEKYQSGTDKPYSDYEEAKEKTKKLIEDAVTKRMVADVPVGTFLSGGIDSSLITAIAQTHSNSPIKTYTIGFETKQEDEAIYAKEIASRLGTDHTECYISNEELLELLADMPIYFDEPFSDSSQIPTMLVSKLAKKDVSVVLSGDGGDELYCGYSMYDWVRKAQMLDPIGRLAYRMPGIKEFLDRMPDKIYAFIKNDLAEYKAQLFTDVRARYLGNMLRYEWLNPKYEFEKDIKAPDWQIKRMLIDIKTYLPDEILCKTDRATMKYSLEGRNPLVDYRLVEDSFRVPHEYKYYRGVKKYILKDITYDYIDRTLLDRPKKGFGVPLALWLREYLKNDIELFLEKDKLKRQGIFKPDGIQELSENVQKSDKSAYSTMLWSFYVFERWYQEYVEDLWGDR